MQRNNPIINAFYQSKEWYKVRNAYYKYKCGVCERCGTSGSKMIVHHKEHINMNNIHDVSITLDFNNLELLCIECHNKEHFGNQTEYFFDDKGDLIKKFVEDL